MNGGGVCFICQHATRVDAAIGVTVVTCVGVGEASLV